MAIPITTIGISNAYGVQEDAFPQYEYEVQPYADNPYVVVSGLPSSNTTYLSDYNNGANLSATGNVNRTRTQTVS